MRLAPTLAIWLVASACLFAPGQVPAGKKDKDPQSAFEPRSRPGAGQKFLEKFVGDWEVAKAFFPRTGSPARQKGSCRQTMIHDGRFLRSEFVFGEGEAKTTGLGLTGFDAATGKFTTVWTDSRATRMSFRESKDDFDGKEIVLYSRSLGDDKGRLSRTVTRLEEDGRKIVHRQYNRGKDDKETLIMELILTRKPAPPGPDR